MNWRTKLAAVSVVLLCASASQAQFIGPSDTPYVQKSDSPWFSMLSQPSFHFEDFEDGLFNSPGASSSTGSVQNPSAATDCVDADDGVVDGQGSACRSFGRTNNTATTGITIDFDNQVLGAYPTHVGLVWTDGGGTTTFEAFGTNLISLGTVSATHADNSNGGTVDEDRFYGFINLGGIRSINIRQSVAQRIEIDHLQYGVVVPEPATLALAGLGLAAMLRRRTAR